MLEEHLNRISQRQSLKLLKGRDSLAFKELISSDLPPYLWDYLNLVLNPQLGGVRQLGNLRLDFSDGELIENLEQKVMSDLEFSAEELSGLVLAAVETRTQFILDPAGTLSWLIFEHQVSESIPSGNVKHCLEGLAKMMEQWNPRVGKAVEVIRAYLAGQPSLPISSHELSRLLKSAIEKEHTQEPFFSVEKGIRDLNNLLRLDAEFPEGVDFTEVTDMMLTGLGLGSWTPVVQLERELLERPLDLETALKALSRLRMYRERGILAAEAEDLATVEAEVDSFTSFLQRVSS